MYNLGANPDQALLNLAKASRTTGELVAGIKQIEEAFDTLLTGWQITYAIRKAGVTPLIDPKGAWSASDTSRLLQ